MTGTKSESVQTRLYLDIDGVILAKSSEFPDTGEQAWGVYSREVVRRLGNLSVERIWLTTWQERALRLEQQLSMTGSGRYLLEGREYDFGDERLDYLNRHIAWRYQALIDDQEQAPAPFVWVEDRLTKSVVDAVHTRFADRPHLLVVTKNAVGLRERDLRAIEEFCGEQR